MEHQSFTSSTLLPWFCTVIPTHQGLINCFLFWAIFCPLSFTKRCHLMQILMDVLCFLPRCGGRCYQKLIRTVSVFCWLCLSWIWNFSFSWLSVYWCSKSVFCFLCMRLRQNLYLYKLLFCEFLTSVLRVRLWDWCGCQIVNVKSDLRFSNNVYVGIDENIPPHVLCNLHIV